MIFFIKLFLAHLLTDFILQPKRWVNHKFEKKAKSVFLYLHGLIATALPLLLLGELSYWPVAVAIGVSHTLIDTWKLYQGNSLRAFWIDQTAHILVLVACSIYLVQPDLGQFNMEDKYLIIFTGYLFVTFPAGILIGMLTHQWKPDENHTEDSLKDAGKLIGIIERLLVITLVLFQQYTAIGFIIAAKSVLRSAKNEQAKLAQSEYILIGTLLSFAIAIFTGIAVQQLIS